MNFNFDAPRAQKARLARSLARKAVVDVLLFTACLLLVGGVLTALLAKLPVGWFAAGLSGPLIAIWAWAVYELRVLKPEQPNSTEIDQVTDVTLLGLLPKEHTPAQLGLIVAELPANQFFTVRFGLDFRMLAGGLSQSPGDSQAVWQAALALRAEIGVETIDASILAVALIKTMPSAEQFLAQYRLSIEEVDGGAAWYHHIDEVFTHHRERRAAGGIGREWSFGYAPLLTQFAASITEHVSYSGILTREIPSHEQATANIIQLLSSGARRNAVLVGGLGSGKTTLIHALARKLAEGGSDVPGPLKYRQIFALDPATLIAQAQGRGQLEELVQHLFYEALHAKNVLLFLDDAQLFFEEGNGAVNISNVLLPVLEGGALQIILAMDEQRWLRISQANPALAQYLNRLTIVPTSKEETIGIMQNQVLVTEHQQRVIYTYQAIEAAYTLSERYAADQVMPGRALKVMVDAARSAENGLVTRRSVEQSLEQSLGVKVGTADSAAERETLLNLEELIHKRMINQLRAVQVVSDALRRARAGVRNSKRPIGTFLFLGPTGVGKTELAKSVAAVFFGGEDRLVRLDLNEFSSANDVARLIAAPADDEHSLTAQIIRQPFSVVLLDEIEKAHPNVLNTLLQLLDEGILRDTNNREVSFRDAVIVATSNAGADRLREHIDNGERLEEFESQFVNELIGRQVFRPEFLNRFDEIVLFRPLNQEELGRVIDLLLTQVNKQLAAQKVSVAVEDAAKQLLVQAGYDPRLGARPMRRVVQRVVENIVATQVLSQQVGAGQTVHITADDVQKMLDRHV